MEVSKLCAATLVAGLPALMTTPAHAGDDELIQELRDQIDRLEARLDAVIDDESEWLTEARADEIRTVVEDVLADADTRTSMLQGGANAGYDSGFFLGSGDGNFKLVLNGQVQVRWALNDADDTEDDDTQWGFEIRRAKLKFKGHVVDPSWKYFINGAFSNKDGSFGLEDAGITKDFGNGWEVTFGQVKAPFNREELVSSSRQLTVDRSLVNEIFNWDRGQGIMVDYQGDQFRFAAMYSDGFRTRNTGALATDADFAGNLRVEWLAAGDWKQFKGFTSDPGSDFGVLVGGGVGWQNGGMLDFFTLDFQGIDFEIDDYFAATADVSLVGDGWNAFAAFFYSNVSPTSDLVDDADPLAFVVQGGIHLNEMWEGFLRYEYADLDLSGVDDVSILTVGVNDYINKNVKWTTDFGYAFDAVPVGASGIEWREDVGGSDGQFVIRSQLQLLF